MIIELLDYHSDEGCIAAIVVSKIFRINESGRRLKNLSLRWKNLHTNKVYEVICNRLSKRGRARSTNR